MKRIIGGIVDWLVDEIRRAWQALLNWQTWVVILVLLVLGVLVYMVSRLALRTDSILTFLHHTSANCREINNGHIIALFSGMIFFMLGSVLTLGELQRHFQARKRRMVHEARQAMAAVIGWGGLTVALACAALVFFKNYCR
ncbi:MAG: hypothetical protein PHT48_03745 [Dechloromonas sp.]|nr:hypothetical protein [Dechloromonas sp.]